MQQMQEGVEKPRPKVLYEVGEMVRVKEGPFTDFNGNVEEVNYEKSNACVGHHLRPRDSGGTGVRAGRKSLNAVIGASQQPGGIRVRGAPPSE